MRSLGASGRVFFRKYAALCSGRQEYSHVCAGTHEDWKGLSGCGYIKRANILPFDQALDGWDGRCTSDRSKDTIKPSAHEESYLPLDWIHVIMIELELQRKLSAEALPFTDVRGNRLRCDTAGSLERSRLYILCEVGT